MSNRGCEGQIAIDAIEVVKMRQEIDRLKAELENVRRTPGPATKAMLKVCQEWLDGNSAIYWPDRARAFIAEWPDEP